MPVDKSDLEAIKAAIISAINSAGGVTGGTTGSSSEEQDRLQKYIDLLEKRNETFEEEARRVDRIRDLKKKVAAEDALQIKRVENQIDLNNARIKQMESAQSPATARVIAALKEQNEELEKEITLIQEDMEAREKATKKIEEQKEAYKSLKEQMSGAVALYGKHNALNVGNVISMGKQIAKAGFLKTAQAGLIGIGIGLIDTIIKITLEMDKATSAMISQTGFTREHGTALMSTRQEMIDMGVSLDDMSKSIEALQPVFTDFTMLSTEMQTSIKDTGAMLAKSGVGLQDYAKNLQLATKGMSMSAQEAHDMTIEIDGFARQILVQPKQMQEDFSKASGTILKFGSDGTRVFKDMAIISKATGLSIDKLIRITEGFDTFEGAATQAGRLNAALGGNFVNAMDLLMATEPAERFNQIRDAILKTGKTFDGMSYFEKNFYVDAIDGIENVTDLALLMSGDIETLAGSTDGSAQSLIDLRKRTEEQQNVMDRFTNALRSLIPDMTDLVNSLHETINAFKSGKKPTTELGKTMVSVANAVRFLVTHAKALGIAFLALWGAKALAGMALWMRQMRMGTVLMYGSGRAAAFSGRQLIAVGLAALGIGKGIEMAATGAGRLAASFKGLGDDAKYAALAIVGLTFGFGSIVRTLSALSPALVKASAGLIPFGAGVALIGGGIGLAAWGMGELAAGMTTMFSAIDIPKLTALAAFIANSGGVNFVGNVLGGGGLAAMAGGIYLIAEALEALPNEAIELLTKLSALEMNVNLAPMTAGVGDLMKEINAVSAIKLASTAVIVQAAASSANAQNSKVAPAPEVKQETPKFEVTVLVDGVVSKAVTHSVRAVDRELIKSGLSIGGPSIPKP